MINIGRNTIFGNPVRIGKRCPVCGGQHDEAGATGPCYRKYVFARISSDEKDRKWSEAIARTIASMPVQEGFREAVKALNGKTLRCPGCGVGSPTCHGRILEEAIRATVTAGR